MIGALLGGGTFVGFACRNCVSHGFARAFVELTRENRWIFDSSRKQISKHMSVSIASDIYGSRFMIMYD